MVVARDDSDRLAYYLVKEAIPEMCEKHYLFTINSSR